MAINPIIAKINQAATATVDSAVSAVNPATPPTLLGNSKLSAVEDALATSEGRIETAITSLETGVRDTQTATGIMVGALQDITASNQISALAKSNADLEAQNANVNLAKAAGNTPTQVKLMADLKQDGARVAELLDERDAIVSEEFTGIGLIDGVINSFRTIQNTADLRVAVAQEFQTKNQINDISSTQEQFARVNAITKQTVNSGTIEAQTKAIAAEGAFKAGQLEIENIRTNAGAMTSLVAADGKKVSNLLQVFRLEGEAQQRQIAVERQAFNREQMTFSREKWLVELPQAQVNLDTSILRLETAKTTNPTDISAAIANNQAAVKRHADAVALETQIVESVQKAQSLAGVPIEPRETVTFKLTNPETRAKYIRLQELGGVERPVLGLTPSEAWANLQLIDTSGTAVSSKGSKILQDIAAVQAEGYRKVGAVIPKTQEQLNADFDIAAIQVMDTMNAEIKAGDASNPMSAPPFTVLSQANAVKSTALYKKVLAPMNMQETDPQRIMDASLNAVLAKVLTPEEAAEGMASIFKVAAVFNNREDGGFERVGLPSQNEYNVRLARVPSGYETLLSIPRLSITKPFQTAAALTGLGDKTIEKFREEQIGAVVTVDLMDETDVQQAMTIILATAKPISDATKEKVNATARQQGQPAPEQLGQDTITPSTDTGGL